MERNAARARGIANLRPGDIALLRSRAQADDLQQHDDDDAGENADEPASTMHYVRIISWRHDGALVRCGVDSRLTLVDACSLFGVPFDVNDKLRQASHVVIEKELDQATDVASRAANKASLQCMRLYAAQHGVDVTAIDALDTPPLPGLSPMLVGLGVPTAPEMPSVDEHDAQPLTIDPTLAAALLRSVTPLQTLNKSELPAPLVNAIKLATAAAVERALDGPPGNHPPPNTKFKILFKLKSFRYDIGVGWAALDARNDVFVPGDNNIRELDWASAARVHLFRWQDKTRRGVARYENEYKLCLMFSNLPKLKSSIPITRYLCASSASKRWEPIIPAIPVTSTFFFILSSNKNG